MALIVCKQCGKEYSNKALSCPSCGGPTRNNQDITCQECGEIYSLAEDKCPKCACPSPFKVQQRGESDIESMFFHWYIGPLKKYTQFSGRATRKEYWMFFLFNFVISIIVNIIDVYLGTEGLLVGLYMLAIILPGIAIAVRRLHDVGKSGLFFLISFIPIVGVIWLIVMLCSKGIDGDNKYGQDPLTGQSV
jgi:uncharacterized membrane protein YhaH (DUF805 family)